mgnify:CR=1 FL=1
MEKLLFTLVVISLIALVITVSAYFGAKFQRYLSEHHLSFHWDYLISALIIILITIHTIYSMVGIITTPEYTKPNGNICKGYKYGWNVCSGNINLE